VCCRRLRLALLASILLASCSRGGRRVERIAILPFDNLAAAPEFAWMSRGLAEAVRLELAGVPGIEPVWIPARRDVPSVGATRVLEGYFAVRGGRLRVHAVIEEAAPVRVRRDLAAGGEGVLPLAQSIARQIDPAARPLPTANAEAFRSYVDALEAPAVPAADNAFERAVTLDPAFGAAYAAWVQSLLARGDRAGAARVLSLAQTSARRFSPLERARIALLAAALAGDPKAERAALVELTAADPADSSVYRRLGDLDAAAHSYRSAAAFYQQAVERDPANIALLNQLGYLRSWAGDLDGAVEALSRYQRLRPNDANPFDSLGDAYYYRGHFAKAEKAYLEAYAKEPGFLGGGELSKAAWARLLQGNLAGADSMFDRFLEARKANGDPLVELKRAEWEYLTGRRAEAVARLARLAPAAGPAASPAWSQLSIWALESGDRERARQYAAQAGADVLGVMCRLFAEPPVSAAEWSGRVARLFPEGPLRRYALAYALLLAKNYAAAIGPLEELYRGTQPLSPEWPAVPLASALIESGRYDRVPELLAGNPPPDPTGAQPLLSLSFPRVFFLRALLAQKQGRTADAKSAFALFAKFSGSPARAAAR
jgi:tetratricopeptide (TPR) repeat protein